MVLVLLKRKTPPAGMRTACGDGERPGTMKATPDLELLD